MKTTTKISFYDYFNITYENSKINRNANSKNNIYEIYIINNVEIYIGYIKEAPTSGEKSPKF